MSDTIHLPQLNESVVFYRHVEGQKASVPSSATVCRVPVSVEHGNTRGLVALRVDNPDTQSVEFHEDVPYATNQGTGTWNSAIPSSIHKI